MPREPVAGRERNPARARAELDTRRLARCQLARRCPLSVLAGLRRAQVRSADARCEPAGTERAGRPVPPGSGRRRDRGHGNAQRSSCLRAAAGDGLARTLRERSVTRAGATPVLSNINRAALLTGEFDGKTSAVPASLQR